jgi:Zn-dependent M28 family amino/carboxypeptidase
MAPPTDADRQLDRRLLGDIWTSDAAYRNLLHLCDDLGSRWAGSESEHRAGAFIERKLEEYGLANVRREPVAFGAWERGPATLRMTAPVAKEFSCIALPYCPAGAVEGELIDVGEGEEEDFARLGDAARGKIAVCAAETNPVGRPTGKLSHRTDKLRRAVDAGAAAFVFVNQNPGLLHITGGIGGPGGEPAPIVAVGVSWETGAALLRLAGRDPGAARLRLETGGRFFANTSHNVVGEIPGATLPEELVLAGAHYDGHDIAQGALDDGAGTVVGLEAARVLAALPREAPRRTLRFVFFCGEEVGLFGSWAYTAAHEDEAARSRFMLNLDTAGRGKGGSEALTLTGAPDLVPYFQAHAAAILYDYPTRHSMNSHSDHFPYALRGIPTATLSSPDDTSTRLGRGWGHTEADTVDKATPRGLQMAAMVAARILLGVARDEAFPGRRRGRDEVLAQLREAGLEEPLRRAGRLDLVGGR